MLLTSAAEGRYRSCTVLPFCVLALHFGNHVSSYFPGHDTNSEYAETLIFRACRTQKVEGFGAPRGRVTPKPV